MNQIQGSLSLNNDSQQFDFKNWLFRIIRLWPWIISSILISFTIAWLNIMTTEPIFETAASIIIKDQKKGGTQLDNQLLKELNLSGGGKLLENEIEVLKSIDLIEEVIRKNNLNIYLKEIGYFSDRTIYDREQPFNVEILNPDEVTSDIEWEIITQSDPNFLLLKTKYSENQLRLKKWYKSGKINFRFLPNEHFISPQTLISKSFKISIINPKKAAQAYKRQLQVKQLGRLTTVIQLSIQDLNYDRGTTFLHSMIEIYNQQGLKDKNQTTANTIDFLKERLSVVEDELKEVEGAVENFKRINKVTSVSSEANIYLDLAKDLDKQKAEQETKVNIVNALEKELIDNRNNPKLVPSTLGIIDPSLSVLIESHNNILLQRERFVKLAGNKNPGLEDLNNQVDNLRRSLLENVKNLRTSYDIALSDITSKDKQLNTRLNSIPLLEKQLLEISRDRNVKEQIYLFLLQKKEESSITLASSVIDSRTIEKPRGITKVKPKPKLIYLTALSIGLIIALIPMLLIDFFDTRVAGRKEIESKCMAPLVGEINYISKMNSAIQMKSNSRSVVSEQIRAIRSALSFTGKGLGQKVILITSHQAGEGKSFTSINLAASYALLNKKVVVLEFDLRKPRLLKNLGLKAENGISNILSGQSHISSVLVEIPDFNGNFFVLPSGPIPPNPAELILSLQMPKLIDELKEKFDYVIIDSPPFSLVTDANLLRQFTDATIIVLRQGYSFKEAYNEINFQVTQSPEKGIYTILNGVNKSWKYSYYAAKYNDSYGYGYGYSSSYLDEKSVSK
jgi:tyrosine-protein kinase Etk/Wzc